MADRPRSGRQRASRRVVVVSVVSLKVVVPPSTKCRQCSIRMGYRGFRAPPQCPLYRFACADKTS